MSLEYVLMVIVPTLIIGMGAQAYVTSQLKKYSKVPISTGMTGAECARGMLAYYNIHGVEVRPGGPGQDFFDPRTNTVTLSPEAYNGRSVTATATACHEVGHAYQYAEDYKPMKIRGSLVPVVNIASNAWIFILILGAIMHIAGFYDLAIILYALVVLFQVVTLPVEFNASRRAMTYMASTGLPQSEQVGSYNVLRACALTYVAAALASALQLLWLFGQRND